MRDDHIRVVVAFFVVIFFIIFVITPHRELGFGGDMSGILSIRLPKLVPGRIFHVESEFEL